MEEKIVIMQSMRRQIVSPCSSVKLEPDVELLQQKYYFSKD
jgi:hypothetical protein